MKILMAHSEFLHELQAMAHLVTREGAPRAMENALRSVSLMFRDACPPTAPLLPVRPRDFGTSQLAASNELTLSM
jgi:hypothetical protein